MHRIQLSVFNRFKFAPFQFSLLFKHHPISAVVVNILLAGVSVYQAVAELKWQHRVRLLEDQERFLQQEQQRLGDQWLGLKKQALGILEKCLQRSENVPVDDLQTEVSQLSEKVEQLRQQKISFKPQFPSSFIFDVLAFVGHLIANIATIGMYGVYQISVLKERVRIFESKNSISSQVQDFQESHYQSFQKSLIFLKKCISSLQTVSVVQRVEDNRNRVRVVGEIDLEQADRKSKHLKERIACLTQRVNDLNRSQETSKEELEKINPQLSQLTIRYRKVQTALEKLKEIKIRLLSLRSDKEKRDGLLSKKCRVLGEKYESLKGVRKSIKSCAKAIRNQRKNHKEIIEEGQELAAKTRQIRERVFLLTDQLNQLKRTEGLIKNELKAANLLVKEFHELEQSVQSLRTEVMSLPGASQFLALRSRIGPIPRAYTPKLGELKRIQENSQAKGFSAAYHDLSTAEEVFRSGMRQILKEIYGTSLSSAITEKPIKTQLTRSLSTPQSAGGQIIYRLVALDFILKGKLMVEGQTYVLQLNNKGIKIVFSNPQNILISKVTDEGQRVLSVVTHFQNRDDFTPTEEELSYLHTQKLFDVNPVYGMDPIAAVCLLTRVLEEEMLEHLRMLLIEPAVEDLHPDLQQTLAFIKRLPPLQAQFIYTLCGLISAMGVCLQVKFGPTAALEEWGKYLLDQEDILPFTKEIQYERWKSLQVEEQQMEWILDRNILAVMREGLPEQDDFYQLIKKASTTYQKYLARLKAGLLPDLDNSKRRVIEGITWQDLNRDYTCSLQLIGQHGCLFSSLLALFVNDDSQLTEENMWKLKKAMAHYLDSLKQAQEEWKQQSASVPQSEANEPPLVSLLNSIEDAIRHDHHCSLAHYQQWLRGQETDIVIEKDENLNPILTPAHIEVAAYTVGVRIALFCVTQTGRLAKTVGQRDVHGRLIPVEERVEGLNLGINYFGPKTEMILCLALVDNHMYNGLFPINLNQVD
jgi:methyl-accepting chemotaxis protein